LFGGVNNRRKIMESKKSLGVGWVIGQDYLIRTVSNYMLGKLEAIDEHELWLRDAAWIAYTGRFSECLAKGSLEEVEPCPDGISCVGRGSIVDAHPWAHGLQRKQKPV
jgi:hypothetical protein